MGQCGHGTHASRSLRSGRDGCDLEIEALGATLELDFEFVLVVGTGKDVGEGVAVTVLPVELGQSVSDVDQGDNPGARNVLVQFTQFDGRRGTANDAVVEVAQEPFGGDGVTPLRSEEHTSELQSR